MEQLSTRDNSTWTRPRSDDIQDVKLMEIVPCPIDGEWDLNRGKPLYVVKNSDAVSDNYEKLF